MIADLQRARERRAALEVLVLVRALVSFHTERAPAWCTGEAFRGLPLVLPAGDVIDLLRFAAVEPLAGWARA